MIERTLLENMDRTAHKASRRLVEITTALEFARKAEELVRSHENRVIAPDESTLSALHTCVRLLQMELADARTMEEGAINAAERARGNP
jgi:hypothetical protein